MNSDNNYNQTDDPNQTAKQVAYSDYSELTDFDSTSEINKAIKNVRVYLTDINADWLCQFDSINDLRRMNKYHSKLFLDLFPEIMLEFVKLVVSIRSNIAKLALILLKEFFGNKAYFIKNYVSEENFGNENRNDNFSNNNEFEPSNGVNNVNNNFANFGNKTNDANSNSKYKTNNNNNRNNFSNSSPKSNFVSNSNRLSNFSVISNVNNFDNNNNNPSGNRHTDFNKNSTRFSDISNNGNFTPVKDSNNNNNSNNNNYFDFSLYQHTVNSIFDTVIPYVLQQSCTMKAFLKDEAHKCLEEIGSCTQSFHFLKKINLQINNKNASYAENAFTSAQTLMQNLLTDSDFFDSENPSNRNLQSVKELFEVNLGLYNLKKDLYAKKAMKLMTQLRNLIGAESFEAVKAHFDNVAKGVIDNMIREGNKATKTTGNLRDNLKSKK